MTFYTPRLGYKIQQIREEHRVSLKMSYGQIEKRLFERDYGRKPTWRDYLHFYFDEANRAEVQRCKEAARLAVSLYN